MTIKQTNKRNHLNKKLPQPNSPRRGRPAGLVTVSWDGTQETMFYDVTRVLAAGMSRSAAYAEQAKKLGRSVSAIENKFRKMKRAKEGVGTAGGEWPRGTGTRELPNKPKNKSKNKGTLTMVRYYAKDDNGLETFLGTGPENAAFAVIKAFQHGSGVAQ
jgi:hypothetical protein